MTPYEKIVSREHKDFPFDDFMDYPRLLLVDWREEEPRIVRSFLKAAGFPADEVRLARDPAIGWYRMSRGDASLTLPESDEVSAQHSTLVALQRLFGTTHGIRYLNHVAFGDTGYFVVETREVWGRLEERQPHVRWFFTPMDILPDVFKASLQQLAAAAQRHARG